MTSFAQRHLGSGPDDWSAMLETVGCSTLETLTDGAVPADIRLQHGMTGLPAPASESEALAELRSIVSQNRLVPSYLGQGYAGCITPPVILRNILENPGWYTAYTPYQAEISQGRLEALLNFQTMVIDLTAMEIANASLLDESTAAAEAMAMAHRVQRGKQRHRFLVASSCHPQTLAVVQTRAEPIGIEVVVADPDQFEITANVFGALVQYPDTSGAIHDHARLAETLHRQDALLVVAADLLALAVIRPPGEWGADVVVGNTQRFGVPLGYGGPHAAYFATRDRYKRQMPGRMIGVSHDASGRPALRMALQTREQHIRREKATSNICTAQVLLAVIAGMYAVYHGPDGLRRIARRIHDLTAHLARAVERVGREPFFDTIRVRASAPTGVNVRDYGDGTVGITLDETTTETDLAALIALLGGKVVEPGVSRESPAEAAVTATEPGTPDLGSFSRTSPFLTHPVFQRYHTEHEMLRYLHRLESRDLSLTTSMIPLGSCTMKLNATAEMIPVTWPELGQLHPFAPAEQATGYHQLFDQLETWLAEITGFAAVSLQPNAGSAGEYAGLLAIRAYHHAHHQPERDVCLIPVSAHGTNPASAVMAGFRVIPVACDEAGNIDVDDLLAKTETHRDTLGALMVTYPSTHGVFEASIRTICRIVHDHGGQVYLDGANMNAQVGLCRPGDYGADVCHLNLHKTFCIPHGGGGPGVGPIGVAEHLIPFLPGDPLRPIDETSSSGCGPVAGAAHGSASVTVISWMYIRMMGAQGLKQASQLAILNANYIARRVESCFPVLYRGPQGLVAHECILDLRDWKERANIDVEDVAKRLMDYGFHAPTMSWPVPGTLMVEPTESESREELDRFCDALIAIHGELTAIEEGRSDEKDNPLKNAPHTAAAVTADHWDHPYPREQAAYPAPWLREYKFWPSVSRIDNVHGDRHLVCSCPSVEELATEPAGI